MITIDGKYKTRDGRPVRILCVDGKCHFPVIGLITQLNGREMIYLWSADGLHSGGVAGYHLVPVQNDLTLTLPPRFTDWLRWMVAEHGWDQQAILDCLDEPWKWEREWREWNENRRPECSRESTLRVRGKSSST